MTTTPSTTIGPVRIHVHYSTSKRLGNWTTARGFEVRARRGVAVLDLRSPDIAAGDVEVRADLDHALLKLLVADDAVVDHWDLRITGRGRVKDGQHDEARPAAVFGSRANCARPRSGYTVVGWRYCPRCAPASSSLTCAGHTGPARGRPSRIRPGRPSV
jgi:hypothetical protein